MWQTAYRQRSDPIMISFIPFKYGTLNIIKLIDCSHLHKITNLKILIRSNRLYVLIVLFNKID